MRNRIPAICLLAFSFAAPATSQSLVYGSGDAQACYFSAEAGNKGQGSTIRTCRSALADPHLTRRDRASTLVNMGVLLMRAGDYGEALGAYDRAIKLIPDLADAHINRGACLILIQDYRQAADALSQSIFLGTEHVPEALFNRAMAFERMGDFEKAYADLKRAKRLRPGWEPVESALTRFKIVPASKIKTG